jgi:hypothetical protein
MHCEKENPEPRSAAERTPRPATILLFPTLRTPLRCALAAPSITAPGRARTAERLSASNSNLTFPAVCPSNELTPQEKMLAFMLLDLSACVNHSLGKGPPPPPPDRRSQPTRDAEDRV